MLSYSVDKGLNRSKNQEQHDGDGGVHFWLRLILPCPHSHRLSSSSSSNESLTIVVDELVLLLQLSISSIRVKNSTVVAAVASRDFQCQISFRIQFTAQFLVLGCRESSAMQTLFYYSVCHHSAHILLSFRLWASVGRTKHPLDAGFGFRSVRGLSPVTTRLFFSGRNSVARLMKNNRNNPNSLNGGFNLHRFPSR